MGRLRRTSLVMAVTLLAGVAFVGVASAQTTTAPGAGGGSAGGDSSAVAVNHRDGSSVFRLGFSVRRVVSDTVDTSNSAVAVASCNECTTVAASIQVVLVMSDASTVNPQNVAMAINYDCTDCSTLAAAYQYVFGDGQPVHLTAEGNRELAQLRREFEALRQRRDLTLQQLADAVAAIAAQVADVVATQTVPAGPPNTSTSTTATTTVPPPASTTTPPPTSSPTPTSASTTTPSTVEPNTTPTT